MCEGRVLEQNMHILNIGVQFVHLLQSKKLVMSSKCGGVVGPRILGPNCVFFPPYLVQLSLFLRYHILQLRSVSHILA